MAKRKKKPSSGVATRVVAPSFLGGIFVGLVLGAATFYVGNQLFTPDSQVTATFPDIDKAFPNVEFEFPERLETTDPNRVGFYRGEDTPSEPKPEEDVAIEVTAEPVIDENVEEVVADPGVDESITGYVLQTGAFGERKHADSFRASLLLEGYDAYMTEVTDSDTPVPFRVIVGPYSTIEQSEDDSERLAQRNISTFLVPLRETPP